MAKIHHLEEGIFVGIVEHFQGPLDSFLADHIFLMNVIMLVLNLALNRQIQLCALVLKHLARLAKLGLFQILE